MSDRFTSTNQLGESILNLRFLKYTGWIPRKVLESDMGIDANIEQVINGVPTARYISVQLKTGFGNVYIDKKNNNFTYYIDSVHYEYWMFSSIPVILALCDPDKEIIYCTLLKKANITTTPTKYKVIINKNRILNATSLEELTAIIDTYQTDFELPAISEEEMTDPDYWFDLLDSCSVTISDSTELLNRLDDKYSKVIQRMSEFYDKYRVVLKNL